MKKNIFCFVMALFLVGSTSAFATYTIQGTSHTERLDGGTVIELKANDSITTASSNEGDIFNAITTKDIEVNGNIVLPRGTMVRGSIKKINPSKRLSKSAQLYLNFDHIVMPSGKQIPIKAGICSYLKLTEDGAVTSGGNYGYALVENWHKTVDITKKATNWGIKSGDAMFNGGRYLVAPFSSLGGALGGGLYYIGDGVADLFKKGDEVVINEGKIFNIMLIDSVDVPVL